MIPYKIVWIFAVESMLVVGKSYPLQVSIPVAIVVMTLAGFYMQAYRDMEIYDDSND